MGKYQGPERWRNLPRVISKLKAQGFHSLLKTASHWLTCCPFNNPICLLSSVCSPLPLADTHPQRRCCVSLFWCPGGICGCGVSVRNGKLALVGVLGCARLCCYPFIFAVISFSSHRNWCSGYCPIFIDEEVKSAKVYSTNIHLNNKWWS